MTGLQSIGCHCRVKVSGAPETLGGFSPEGGRFELSLEDVRISQDEKGQMNVFQAERTVLAKALETGDPLVSLQTFSVGGAQSRFGGKSMRMRSNQRW